MRVSRAELESACGASVVRRSTDVVYFTREMLELALADVYDEFFAVSFTENSVGLFIIIVLKGLCGI